MSIVSAEIENMARSLVSFAFPDRINCPMKISSSVLENGENFLGMIYNVSVGDENDTLHLVLKVAPQHVQFRTFVPVREVYKAEIFTYQEILREFLQIQQEKILKSHFQALAKMYASQIDPLQECLLMENVKRRGFRLRSHRIPVDYPHASLVMRELGKFHALSFAVRDQKPEIFGGWEDQCHEPFYNSNVQFVVLKSISSLIDAVLNSYPPQQNEKERKALEELDRNLPAIYKSALSVSKNDRKYSVVTHGDLEVRNVLFKYGNPANPEHPSELCMLDWQSTHLASPALDVLHFIFTGSDQELRKQHYKKLIEEYYNSFTSFLRELGSDPEDLLPFSILLHHLRKFSGFVLAVTIWLNATNLKDSDDVPDILNAISEEALAAMSSSTPTRGYLKRMRDLISDMMEFDYPFSKLIDQ